MTDAAPRRWTMDEFFAWQEGQAERYELVDGFPVRMMAGARNVHDDIVVNVLAELRGKLRGRDCRPFTGDGSIETNPGKSTARTSASIAGAETRMRPKRRCRA